MRKKEPRIMMDGNGPRVKPAKFYDEELLARLEQNNKKEGDYAF